MGKHNCERYPLRRRYDTKPACLISRFWRWHINYCPGWKKYMASLDETEQARLREQYNLKG